MNPHWLEWVAAIAEITAGVCLAIPGLRLSKHMLQRRKIQEKSKPQQTGLERLRQEYIRAMSELLANWDSLDHWLVRIGFSAFIISAVMGLLGMMRIG